MADQRRKFLLQSLVLLMAVCWPQQVAGGSAHAAHMKNGDGGKWAAHAHRHHHRVDDPMASNNNNNNNNQDYVQDMASASDDNLIDYETDDNAETGSNDVNVSDASPLMGVLPEPGTYMASNCTSCIQREELRRRNLEVIKDQILSKLGMQRAPNMTGRLPPRIPPLDHLLDLYGMQGDAPPGRHSAGVHHHAHHQHQQSDQAFQTGPVYDEEDDDFHARTEKVIAFSQLLPQVRQALKRTESTTTKGMESIYFKFSDKVTRSSKVDKAHLWLYIQNQQPPSSGNHGHQRHHHHHHHQQAQVISKSASANASTVWIHIYKVVRVPEGESPVLNPVRMTRVALPPLLELVDKVPASAGKQQSQAQSGGWVSFEVRKVVADWFRWPEDNLGLVVHAVSGDQHAPPPPTFNANGAAAAPAAATTPTAASSASSGASKSLPFIVNDHVSADGALMPFVEVVTTDGRKHRTKRTIGLNCDETSSETRCCRYPLTVDFVEFGWDWIIAPKKYEANYCSGECPYVFLQKYPHTHIVQQANPAGTAGPCCAPRKMSPISMLYFDNEFNIIHGNLPGMVVDRCGCS